MDSNWFKARHREAGVTQAEAAAQLGKTPTFLTRIYAGQQEMRFSEAEKLAAILKVSVADVLERAGLELPALPVRQLSTPGFAESDAAVWIPKQDDAGAATIRSMAETLGAGTLGRDIWRISTRAMLLAGYAEGDFILVDQKSQPVPGDAVIAQVYDWDTGSAVTVLRRYDPPVLTAASTDPADWKSIAIDNVKIMGVVTASWRTK